MFLHENRLPVYGENKSSEKRTAIQSSLKASSPEGTGAGLPHNYRYAVPARRKTSQHRHLQ